MSPLNKKTIHEKLFKLRESVKILEELRAEGRKAFFADRKTQDASTLNLFTLNNEMQNRRQIEQPQPSVFFEMQHSKLKI